MKKANRQQHQAKQPSLLQSIQVLRGIAALLVVISHIGVIERRFGSPGQNLLSGADIGQAGVDLFFIISGFIMTVTMATHFGKPAEIGRFLKRRFIRIYPIYWVYALMICLVILSKPGLVNSSVQEETRYISSFLLLPAPGGPLMPVAWTLEFEVFFYCVFALLMWLPFRWFLPILTILFVSMVTVGEIIGTEGYWKWWITRPILLEFLFGVILGHLHLQKRWGQSFLLIGAGLVWLTFDTLTISSGIVLGLGDSVLERPVYFGLPMALILFGVVSLEQKKGVRFPLALQRLGDASYSLYLSQVLVITTGGRIWSAIGGSQLPLNALLIVLLLGSSILAGWLSYKFIERPLIIYFQRHAARDYFRLKEFLPTLWSTTHQLQQISRKDKKTE